MKDCVSHISTKTCIMTTEKKQERERKKKKQSAFYNKSFINSTGHLFGYVVCYFTNTIWRTYTHTIHDIGKYKNLNK